MKAGNDGRRPSGVVWQRTKMQHYTLDGYTTLCKRPIGSLVLAAKPSGYICSTCYARHNAHR
jgi:hypothetical protein